MSERQIQAESNFNPRAVSPVGAQGLAQVMPKTREGLERRLGRALDPFNEQDALLMHREVMRENIARFKNPEDALRAYNAGFDPKRWNNPETVNYVAKITGQGGAGGQQPYTGFAPVRKDIDAKSLNDDADWQRASLLLYSLWERKEFTGTPRDLSEWGKDFMGNFNYNMVQMSRQAYDVIQNGSQQDKEAFLWMMDTYDNTNISWEGAGRAAKGMLTDPTNLVGVASLGAGFLGKAATKQAAKAGLRAALTQSLARTGIAAGVDSAVFAAADSSIRQGVEVSAGRRQEIDLSKVGVDAAIGAGAGLVLGTAADLAVSKIAGLVRKTPSGAAQAVPEVPPSAVPEVVSGVTPQPQARVAGAVDNAARGSTLTPAEIAEATARQQDGRLAADQAVPMGANRPVDITVPETNTGLRTTRVTDEPVAAVGKTEINDLAEKVVEQLRPLKGDDLTSALESLRTGRFTVEGGGTPNMETFRVIARAVQIHSDEIRVDLASAKKELAQLSAKPDADPERILALQERVGELETRLGNPLLADDAFGSIAGTILQDRQKGLPGVQGITPESIMAERGVTKAEADEIWADLVGRAQQDAEVKKVAAEYDARAQAAIEAGNFNEAALITAQKHRELDGMVDQIAPKSASVVDKLTELAISNVFSLKTVLVNLIPSGVKTLAIPALKALFNNPFEKATRAEMVGAYSAMRSSFNAALRAGYAGWKYEQALLTRDGARLVEGEMALSGKLGGAIRLFPRILNATDEFLSRINYDAFVAGRAAAEAAIDGAEKGLKGKALDAFIKEASDKAVVGARGTEKMDQLVQPIINKGLNLGLKGDELFQYVEREAVKNPDALKKGTDEEALNFVRDVLYKRDFTGDNPASRLAQSYEETMKKFPTAKLVIGQLFFRTPVRVFEEGIRLTPGLQFLAPKFMDDLRGVNGPLREARAKAEAMSSLAIAGGVLSLYGQGRITGDGAYDDYKQTKARRDGPQQEPYTIKMSDGSTWSYKGFDPLATPVKIMINALERMDKLRIREAQGEFVDKNVYKYGLAAITVATASVAQAIRDASLVEGADNFIKFVESAFTPDESEDAFIKALGDKLFLLVPNTLHKIARDNDPTMRDPQTFFQMVEEKLLRPLQIDSDAIQTPYAYDVIGNVRRMSDTGSLWNVFSTASVEERMKGMTQEQAFVLEELDKLTRITGETFATRPKRAELGDMDLRTVKASDGKSTLYDVWQRNYQALQPEQALMPLLQSPLPTGTFKYHEGKGAEAKKIINELQTAAFQQMLAGEQQVIDKLISEELNKAKAKAGMFDAPSR